MIIGFSILTAVGTLAAVRGWKGESRALLLPGATSHGHYQIELSCESCHTPFGGVAQDACTRCHQDELEREDDSHPVAKFRDPRNADLLNKLDALRCVTCHVEHRPERTLVMGVTEPKDVCFHCHSDIGTERASHEGMAFSTCGDAGCHNFHDNRALNADYLAKQLDAPRMLEPARLPSLAEPEHTRAALTARDSDAPREKRGEALRVAEWAGSEHARAGINCSDCHGAAEHWIDRPTHVACKACHERQTAGFLSGHHGMRLMEGLEVELSAMRPELARLPMRKDAAHKQLGCQSCHAAHGYDRTAAAVEACLGCHADTHSVGYLESKHFALVKAEREGTAPLGSGVTCAGCHMPRTREGHVEHNQNGNLRPNEAMALDVCSHCHGLGFTLDALADRALLDRGVRDRPARHIESLDMVRRQLAGRSLQRANTNP